MLGDIKIKRCVLDSGETAYNVEQRLNEYVIVYYCTIDGLSFGVLKDGEAIYTPHVNPNDTVMIEVMRWNSRELKEFLDVVLRLNPQER